MTKVKIIARRGDSREKKNLSAQTDQNVSSFQAAGGGVTEHPVRPSAAPEPSPAATSSTREPPRVVDEQMSRARRWTISTSLFSGSNSSEAPTHKPRPNFYQSHQPSLYHPTSPGRIEERAENSALRI